MEIRLEEDFSTPVNVLPVQWDEHLARWISDILCPPITGFISMLIIAHAAHERLAWLWISIAVLLTIVAPVGYILWKVRCGEISDFHIPVRSQRIRPALLTIMGALSTLALFWLGKAPALLLSMTFFGIALAVMILLITLRWKISGHSTAIAILAVVCVHFIGQAFLPMLLLIPLVAWARVRIRRHSLSQTIAGAALGVLYVGLMLC